MPINKSLATNIISLALIPIGLIPDLPGGLYILNAGLFAFSGAITNWLAIYMLFEKVPGLYGSGVIPERFNEFKQGIRQMIMQQFFNRTNIERFFAEQEQQHHQLELTPLLNAVDFTPAFTALTQAVMSSSFGAMLGMFGGEESLSSLKQPFIENLKTSLADIAQGDEFQHQLHELLRHNTESDKVSAHVEQLVDRRLSELTPQLVKEIIEQMIAEHLGWLVVWGGIFGGVIGLVSTLFY